MLTETAEGGHTRAFDGPGAQRRAFPFAVATLLGFLLLPLPSTARHHEFVAPAAVLTALIVAAVVLAPWERLPAAAHAVPPFAYLVAVGLLHYSYADSGGIEPLALLPVVWLALYGTRAELAACVIAVAALVIVPQLVDGHDNPATGWRNALMWSAVAGVVGFTIQRLVAGARRADTQALAQAADLSAVTEVTRALARRGESDARPAICAAALRVSGGRFSALWEPTTDGAGLAATSSAPTDIVGSMLPFGDDPAVSVRVFESGEADFVADVPGRPQLCHALAERVGAESALVLPVAREGVVLGVLVVSWARRLSELAARVRSLLETVADEAAVAIERANLLARLESAARTDELTDLPNRRAWEEELHRELARSRREGTPVCVAMVDLDHFKAYNDAHGHQEGDRLLIETTVAWSRQLRGSDMLVRYGGEEFAVLLPNCGLSEGRDTLERLATMMPSEQTCSAGVAVTDGSEDREQIIARVDAALYEAKRGGRNRVVAS